MGGSTYPSCSNAVANAARKYKSTAAVVTFSAIEHAFIPPGSLLLLN
jgi:hypothetical protein